jgi:hypothetical protein
MVSKVLRTQFSRNRIDELDHQGIPVAHGHTQIGQKEVVERAIGKSGFEVTQ